MARAARPGPLTRRSLISSAALLGIWAAAPLRAAPCKPPRVLFVCQFGSVKSPISREHFRAQAAKRNVQATAASRGITPQEHLAEGLARQLASEKIDPKREALQKLSKADLDHADVVVAFDRLPAGLSHPRLVDWSDLPSMNANYPAARTILLARMEQLLDHLKSRDCT